MKRFSTIAAASLTLPLALVLPAFAQEGPVTSAGAVEIDAQIRDFLDAPTAPLTVSTDAFAAEAAPATRRTPHGQASVGVGTNGFRSFHLSTVVPLGENGTAAVAIGETRGNGWFGPQRLRSLSVGAALGPSLSQPAAPCTVLGGEPGMEPLWVTRMRATQPAPSLGCPPVYRR